MSDLENLPYYKIKTLLANKKISCLEIVRYFISKAKKDQYNAFRIVTEKQALSYASICQERVDQGKMKGLECLPIAVKDNFCTQGISTTACSKILENFIPPYESTVTQKIFNDGSVMIGKTNMDEFAIGSLSMNSAYGHVINPYKKHNSSKNLVAGGSSGGSAVAVAARMCVAALGTDTGGSIRLPASFTGTIGMKPTYGRCSRYGIISFASSFDQAGVFTNNVIDNAMIMKSICGFDYKDSTSEKIDNSNFMSGIGKSIKGMKIGIPKEYMLGNVSESINERITYTASMLRNAGAEIVEISLPHTANALPVYYTITSAEASSNLSRYDGVRYGNRVEKTGDSFSDMVKKTRYKYLGEEVQKRIITGTYVLSSNNYQDYYVKAQKIRRMIYEEFKQAFQKVKILITPTSKSTAFPIDIAEDCREVYNNDIFTVPSSLAGIPAMSFPIGHDIDGLPVGIQLLSNHFEESEIYKIARILEINKN